MSKRTAVYRFFDAQDVLLYIGITEDPKSRFASHEALKPWWGDVARHAIEWRETREEAAVAEIEAIQAERPAWNVVGSPCPPERPMEPWIREAIERGDVTSVSGARNNLTETVESVKILRRLVVLMKHRKPAAVLVPVELGDAVVDVGGPDAAVQILQDHLKNQD
jgi:predicted GIY-YIG superfamily endonuclease